MMTSRNIGLTLLLFGVACGTDHVSAQLPLPIAPSPSPLQDQAIVGGSVSMAMLERMEQLEANQQRLEALLAAPNVGGVPINGAPYGAGSFGGSTFDGPIIGDSLEQNAPGAALLPEYDALPNYVYSPSYYNTSGVGARPLADYAPPGYEARDQQEGPAEPEFERITPPQRLSPEALDDFVTRGMYPGSFLVPGTSTSVRLRGFVRLASMYDFEPAGVPDAFVTNSIPVPQQVGDNFNMSSRMSRFALETWTPTSFCDWNVHTMIEGDFFNGLGQAAGGGGNPFRLRHAFFDFGYFRFGQQNSVFMDSSNWPSLVDFQGPNSWTNQRQPSMRITIPIGQRMYWAGSVERPFSDITTLDATGTPLGTNVQNVPDLATHWRYEGNRGHLQVAGLLRTIGYRPTGGSVDRLTGAGISGNASLHPWAILLGTDTVRDRNPSGWTRSRLLMQATWGSSVSRYINDLPGQGLDGQVDPLTGEFNLVEATGWNVSYEQWFTEHWLSNFTYSSVDVDNNPNVAATTYDSTTYLAASLWWIPVPRLSFAVEYITGDRENVDGQSADADRLNGLAQYNF